MNTNQSFNLSADIFGSLPAIFMKLVFVIITVYVIMMILNFLRDKFIHKESTKKEDHIDNLLILLSKIFLISGFGFIIANTVKLFLQQATTRGNIQKGEWNDLTFGIIIIFISIALNAGRKVLVRKRTE
ncbi:hypothetical protein [Carboxylicivirga linearis]|uniref:DUF2975 domain-containing protein n=1 Tax=Carboxylicivirga linearis TaxID=1628157 RepID=A0ABS5JVQ3_9BACT|nr:hypothetical protein [Carboxylicivirga linearis]MBS2098411.1 hypothetical protein [Carboxylicivirga linearis]